MKTKIEYIMAGSFFTVVIGSLVFMLVSVFKTSSTFDGLEKMNKGLLLVAGCSMYCRDSGGIYAFKAPDYCLPKKFLGIKYSESCTPLTICRCGDGKSFIECKMVSDVKKVCESDDGSSRETVLE